MGFEPTTTGITNRDIPVDHNKKFRPSRRFFFDILAASTVYAAAQLLDASPAVGLSWLAELAGIKQSWAGGNIVYYRGADYIEVDGKSYPIRRDVNGDINIVIHDSMQLRISK